MENAFSTFQELFVKSGLSLNFQQYEALKVYSEFLVEYNEKVNLTAITEQSEIWKKHFLDSIYPIKLLDIPESASVIDVGTGAGFPSVPMAIYRNDLEITMIDSLQKRIIFLEHLAVKTKLNFWNCIHGRAEDLGNKAEYREKYDIAVARAVAPLPILCEYCLPFVKIGGKFIALKGPKENAIDAINAVSELGGQISKEISYNLCGDDRKLIVISKVSQTPTKYPRRSKKIQQLPL